MTVFKPDLNQRKKLLRQQQEKHRQWPVRMAVVGGLFVIAACIPLGTVLLLVRHPTHLYGVLLFLGLSLGFACVPFFAAFGVKHSSQYKCGLPYSSYANGFLFLSDSTLEYVYWQVGREAPAAYSSKRAVYDDEDKFSYTIEKDEILSISCNDGVCYIQGRGSLKSPVWCKDAMDVGNGFSFLLAFEGKNIEKTILKWRV